MHVNSGILFILRGGVGIVNKSHNLNFWVHMDNWMIISVFRTYEQRETVNGDTSSKHIHLYSKDD